MKAHHKKEHEHEKERRAKGGKVEHHEKKHRAKGGKVDVYEGSGSNLLKEAQKKTQGILSGEKSGNRLDKPKRASGGGVKMPTSMGSYGDYSAKEMKGSGGSPFTKAHKGEDDRQLARKSGGKC